MRKGGDHYAARVPGRERGQRQPQPERAVRSGKQETRSLFLRVTLVFQMEGNDLYDSICQSRQARDKHEDSCKHGESRFAFAGSWRRRRWLTFQSTRRATAGCRRAPALALAEPQPATLLLLLLVVVVVVLHRAAAREPRQWIARPSQPLRYT